MRKIILFGTVCCALLGQNQFNVKAQEISLSNITTSHFMGYTGQKKVQNTLLDNIQKTGATLYALDTEHGLQSWVSQKDDKLLPFFLTPDGKAMVSGVIMNMSPDLMLQLDGKHIDQIPAMHGLEGLFVKTGDRFQVFYITPDRKKVIPGMMWDEEGRNITQTQIASLVNIKIPNPTNKEVTSEPKKEAKPLISSIMPSMNIFTTPEDEPSKAIFALLNQSYAGIYGKENTPALLIFIDPLCHFSKQAISLLTPFVKAGKIHLVIIPVAVLDVADNNQSSKQARILLSVPATQMMETWISGVSVPLASDANQKLAINQQLLQGLQLRGTPIFFWQRPDKSIRRFEGLPDSMESLVNLVEKGQ